VNLGRIIVQGKEAAYVGEQLQAGGGLRLFSRKDSVKRQQGLVCPSAACGPGDGQQGNKGAEAWAAKGRNPGIGEILGGQIADELGVVLGPGSKGFGEVANFPSGILSPKGDDLFFGPLPAKNDRDTERSQCGWEVSLASEGFGTEDQAVPIFFLGILRVVTS